MASETTIRFTGGRVLTDTGWIEADLTVQSGVIVSVGTPDDHPHSGRRIDVTGLRLIPGLIDLQINGGFGSDFTNDPETIWQVGSRLPEHGVTAFLPTIITAPQAAIDHAQQVMVSGPPDGYSGAAPLGLHVEGPMLSPLRPGTHDLNLLRTPPEVETDTWSPEGGVLMVTLAPELPGAPDLVEALAGRGVVVALGHSDATFEQAMEAFSRGAVAGTHLFSAMSPFHHRHPGMVGAILDCNDVVANLIIDGIHSDPAAVRLAWRIKKPDRFVLITDAMAAMGMGTGAFPLGNVDVMVSESGPRNPSGDLAGSTLTMDAAVRLLMEFTGCSLAEAVGAATLNPARLLGDPTRESLSVGSRADVALLDSDSRVVATLVSGRTVFAGKGFEEVAGT